jgi:predicted RNase H-like nuclease (RuvC/YqgF family)
MMSNASACKKCGGLTKFQLNDNGYPCFCESDTIQVSRAEYEALRAEVASLKELLGEQKQTIAALNSALGGEGSCTTDNLVRIGRLEMQNDDHMAAIGQLENDVRHLTQQLDAANGRVEMLRKSLYLISVVEQGWGSNLRPQDMVDIAVRAARAALSNLNEDSAG